MAVYNEILIGRFNRALQKLTGIKGGPPSRQLSSEIMPVLPFPIGISERYHYGWETFAQSVFVTAGAAQTSSIRLRNPAGSNVLAEVLSIKLATTGTAYSVQLTNGSLLSTDLGLTGTNGNRLDPRGRAVGSCIFSSGLTAAVPAPGNTALFASVPANGNSQEMIESLDTVLPLLPGDLYSVNVTSVNTAMTGGFLWRERFLEETERT